LDKRLVGGWFSQAEPAQADEVVVSRRGSRALRFAATGLAFAVVSACGSSAASTATPSPRLTSTVEQQNSASAVTTTQTRASGPSKAPAPVATTSSASVAASYSHTAPGATDIRNVATSARPTQVATSLATWYLRELLFQDGGSVTAVQRRAVIRQLAVSCSAAQYGQYPCSLYPPNRTPPIQRCAALASRSGEIETARCRGEVGAAPVVRPGYVNCATIGHVVAIQDPSHDTTDTQTFGRRGTAYNARADLLEVRVAERAGRFCVDFETARLPGQWSTLRVALGQHGEYVFQPSVSYTDDHGPEVESGGSAIPGQVGTSGTWTSLVVTSEDSQPETLPTRFGFQAYAEWEPRTPGRSSLILDQTRAGRYP
jgi:hypothetical protein